MRLKAVVLAAGKGTRLKTEGRDLPKVMREACARPLLRYVLEAISFIDKADTVIVAGYKKEDVMAAFGDYPFAVQAEQLGTGHAVMSARQLLEGFDGSVLICYGDMPLLTRETYEALVRTHAAEGNDCTILSSSSDEELPYGRIVRDGSGSFVKIVEDRDCTAAERAIRELNTGLYVFEAAKLLPALSKLQNNNAQGEYYLTDVPAILRGEGARIGICMRALGDEIIGVNTLEQLKQVEDILRQRGAC
ncbi:UDP-N-acetylglucosamine pyrophosphorylase [Sporobacter termitidis DSM 10068]|uniref:UDP-N-acetylglucosamine pyrophosphorylase n=1 Tax=Sporobacter termitidis DSM 10068 TaxID=1123282 RepID=A0A1M5ZI81_9FIRM|nr:NTP transferase domain-containing protein [Sporobacter termitidis]SHI23633.1 UDP-N-acetylglucosamine pyrophosphorylase [Sporobacter termitidis DSM 10068]